jgi:hypothetical protein
VQKPASSETQKVTKKRKKVKAAIERDGGEGVRANFRKKKVKLGGGGEARLARSRVQTLRGKVIELGRMSRITVVSHVLYVLFRFIFHTDPFTLTH